MKTLPRRLLDGPWTEPAVDFPDAIRIDTDGRPRAAGWSDGRGFARDVRQWLTDRRLKDRTSRCDRIASGNASAVPRRSYRGPSSPSWRSFSTALSSRVVRALSQQDVDDTVAKALASVTPPPAFSELVYQAVQPSLVLIETKTPHQRRARAGRRPRQRRRREPRRRHPDQPPRRRRRDRDRADVRRRHADRAARSSPSSPRTTSRSCVPPSRPRTSCRRSSATRPRCARAARRTRWAARSASTAR